jgi:hypothetical protein
VVLKDKGIFAYAIGEELYDKYEDVCLAQFLEEKLQKMPQGEEKELCVEIAKQCCGGKNSAHPCHY